MPHEQNQSWCPFRPRPEDFKAIEEDVAEIPAIQKRTLDRDKSLQFPDRVAHQYQIAGGKVFFKVADTLPAPLPGVGLFQPGAEHMGIGRVSLCLGTPHAESQPDFLGLMVAFQTPAGQRVDFLAINSPAAPTDNHRDFMSVLHATAESAGVEVPLIGAAGDHDAVNFAAQQTVFGKELMKRMGPVKGAAALAHLFKQALRAFHSSTAYQAYWTGIVELGGTAGKFTFVPKSDENRRPGLHPGERHFSEDWKARQSAGDIEFRLYWIPFLDEARTTTKKLTHPWDEDHRQFAGTVRFPRTDLDSDEAKLWSILAGEMGVNSANWVVDAANSISEPCTEFGLARKIAYQRSQTGRNALAPESYSAVFETARISPELAQELRRRWGEKAKAGHISQAP